MDDPIQSCRLLKKAMIASISESERAGLPPLGGMSTPVLLSLSPAPRPTLMKSDRSLSLVVFTKELSTRSFPILGKPLASAP